MKITQAHRDYWIQKRGPSFLRRPSPKSFIQQPLVTIDNLIRDETDKRDKHFDAHNTIVLIRMRMRRGISLRQALEQSVINNDRKRMHYAARWLRRMNTVIVPIQVCAS